MSLARAFRWAGNALHRLAQGFLGLLPWRRESVFRVVRVEDLPDDLKEHRVYLAGEGVNVWAAAMRCPCGCGDRIELNLLPQSRPSWRADVHGDGTVSLTPSVWRQKGCRSHFILRLGRITWC